jgi:hypothetical protein
MNRQNLEENWDRNELEPDRILQRDISMYLGKVGFADRVMLDVLHSGTKARMVLLWGIFCLLNLSLLLLFGTNQPFIVEFLALHAGLSQFFFLFLGITFLGSVIGLVLSVDTSWLQDFLHRTPDQ